MVGFCFIKISQIKLFSLNVMKTVFLLIISVVLFACDEKDAPVQGIQKSQEKSVSLLEAIQQRGKLIVLTSNLPTTYYYDRDNHLAGPEYDMTQSFAASLQVDVESLLSR